MEVDNVHKKSAIDYTVKGCGALLCKNSPSESTDKRRDDLRSLVTMTDDVSLGFPNPCLFLAVTRKKYGVCGSRSATWYDVLWKKKRIGFYKPSVILNISR